MKNIDVFMDALKDEYAPILTRKIEDLFASSDIAVKGEIATELLTAIPFEIMTKFHNFAFGDVYPQKDGAARLQEDRQGHIGMSGKAIMDFFNPADTKTPAQRYDYFKGITIVFPYMLVANHHRWLFDGVADAKDYGLFMDANMPVSTAKYEPILKAAYDDNDQAALCKAYVAQACEHPFDLLKNYYNFVK